jgi:hypothetical protein
MHATVRNIHSYRFPYIQFKFTTRKEVEATNHRDRYYRVTADRENETEVREDDRIRKHTGVRTFSRVSFWASHSNNIIYYSPPANRPHSKKETSRWRVLYRITRQLLHRVSIH